MEKLNLSAPWYIYRNKLAALFELDEDVTVSPVTDDGDILNITVTVKNHEKADALNRLLKKQLEFGDMLLAVEVQDASGEQSPAELVKAAFAYNRAVRSIEIQEDSAGADHVYVVFDPEPVQFFADDLSDYRGNFNALAEDVARELFEVDPSVNFCTADLAEN